MITLNMRKVGKQMLLVFWTIKLYITIKLYFAGTLRSALSRHWSYLHRRTRHSSYSQNSVSLVENHTWRINQKDKCYLITKQGTAHYFYLDMVGGWQLGHVSQKRIFALFPEGSIEKRKDGITIKCTGQ